MASPNTLCRGDNADGKAFRFVSLHRQLHLSLKLACGIRIQQSLANQASVQNVTEKSLSVVRGIDASFQRRVKPARQVFAVVCSLLERHGELA